MKPNFIVFALIACGAGLSALAEWPTHPAHVEQKAVVAEIDFAALQQQADAALDHLRQAQPSHEAQLNHQPLATAGDRRYSLLVPSK